MKYFLKLLIYYETTMKKSISPLHIFTGGHL